MYYPYLRGRQNELLCLRELLEKKKLDQDIIPVIEPVKFSNTFISTLNAFIKNERYVVIVRNPQVGSFNKEYAAYCEEASNKSIQQEKSKVDKVIKEFEDIKRQKYIINAVILTSDYMNVISNNEVNIQDTIIINTSKQTYQFYDKNPALSTAKLTFVPKGDDFEDVVSGSTVLLEDCFNKAKKNSDYIDNQDELFTKIHLKYKQKGYVGFSDYSIIGKDYEESGFAPLAVAIHIVYFVGNNDLRIHHFVSSSNNTWHDPAKKFQEAMQEIVAWEDNNRIIHTLGFEQLLSYYYQKKYPGLGVIKKYTLMHHLELIGMFLEEQR